MECVHYNCSLISSFPGGISRESRENPFLIMATAEEEEAVPFVPLCHNTSKLATLVCDAPTDTHFCARAATHLQVDENSLHVLWTQDLLQRQHIILRRKEGGRKNQAVRMCVITPEN